MACFRLFGCGVMMAMYLGVLTAQVGAAPQAEDVAPVLRDMSPVTDEMLRSPSADDWLHWRRTSDGQGYSPLAEINRDNVQHLQLAWSWAMDPGSQVTTPVVHDGVMFLASPGGVIQALDAATGDFLWEYRDRSSRRQNSVRGLSIYKDALYLNTSDARIVAVDARTGDKVWDVQVADPETGFRYTAASLIARGKVISGLQNNNFLDEKNAVTAHDATGAIS